ncbi:MAG: biopolymer transporter ExbD [Prevotellaceae bacterium]|jgi:biopolymer transport protein ExbD|nr:biopolymer transporter ExbD [Prevotellaceae bacterium]
MAKRSTPELSTSSMADIAFLLLTFFLLTTTMDQNLGMPRRLPPLIEDEQEKPPEINKRNIMQVRVNSMDLLLVNSKPIEVQLLKNEVKEFLLNPRNEADKPEKELKNIELLGGVSVGKGVVSLQTDRGTSYKMYMAVQNEIMRAYSELRNEYSVSRFQSPYAKLTEDQQKAIRSVYPLNISEAEPRDKGKKGK